MFNKLKVRIQRLKDTKLKPISIQEYELLDTQKQVNLLVFLANLLRYASNAAPVDIDGAVAFLHISPNESTLLISYSRIYGTL